MTKDPIDLILLIILASITLILFIYFVVIELNKKELDPMLVKQANDKIKKTAELDPNLSLIESHKIMVNTLKTVFKNKKLNSAKMLGKIASKLKNEKEFWYYHRLRNKAAHEDNFRISNADVNKARKVFQEALKATTA